MYIPIQYPKWLYHATLPACIVANFEEHEALGDEWVEHPDLVDRAQRPTDGLCASVVTAAAVEEVAPADVKPATKKRANNGR